MAVKPTGKYLRKCCTLQIFLKLPLKVEVQVGDDQYESFTDQGR